ncbi:hypothetical protein KIP88_41135 [Bradyrhizobium sp. SRL28]|uniref:hypothetical protein n=1 Tax=Bradyrhizobium sp. SRL28 TaxID=2836178 RepID=UPI001BDE7573|nr:hypothetical protein [Bradyrhizobium sp. SRL28]MBT1516813.1 hypothetical protein [Bradyrhizobium sp. SRL28]
MHKTNDIAYRSPFVLFANEEFGPKDLTLMATPGQLVECVASALNVPQATVVLYDRVLAEKGLRSKGGRGKSAAKVTVEDAANLLIAIAGTSSGGIATAARTVELYSGLRYQKRSSWKDLISDETPADLVEAAKTIQETDFLTVPGMEGLGSNHSFRDGLVALIEAVRQQKISFKKREASDWARAYVSLEGPSFIDAGISVDLTNYPRAYAKYELRDNKVEYSDLNWRQTFSHRAILPIAQLLGLEDAQPAKAKNRAA